MAQSQDKAGRRLDATGETVQSNIRRIRDDVLGIPVTELSRRLEALGRPIPPLGLRRIEDGTRRVDVDDLVSIAVALGVSPATLLMPESASAEDAVTLTGCNEQVPAGYAWEWIGGDLPLPDSGESALAFYARAVPTWAAKTMEQRLLSERGLRSAMREMIDQMDSSNGDD